MLLGLFLSFNLATSTDITYTKDIQPIFQNRCAQCHNPAWPDKNWLDYEVVKKNADKIKLRLENKTMPPGNTTNMTEEERTKVIQWINGGSKK